MKGIGNAEKTFFFYINTYTLNEKMFIHQVYITVNLKNQFLQMFLATLQNKCLILLEKAYYIIQWYMLACFAMTVTRLQKGNNLILAKVNNNEIYLRIPKYKNSLLRWLNSSFPSTVFSTLKSGSHLLQKIVWFASMKPFKRS